MQALRAWQRRTHRLDSSRYQAGNILLETTQDQVKLTDFGLARVVDDVKLTRTGLCLARPCIWRPNRRGAKRPIIAPISSAWARSCTRCAPASPRSRDSAFDSETDFRDKAPSAARA